jgi:hypothetical protein
MLIFCSVNKKMRTESCFTLAIMIADGTTTPAAGAVSVQECADFATIPPDQLGPLLALANMPGGCATLAAALETAGVTTASVFLDEVCAAHVVQLAIEITMPGFSVFERRAAKPWICCNATLPWFHLTMRCCYAILQVNNTFCSHSVWLNSIACNYDGGDCW